MRSHKKITNEERPDVSAEVGQASQPKKKDAEDRIYDALDVAEKIAVKLAKINQLIKKEKKKKKKKAKKLGKIDKKTGTLILKKEKKQKKGKALKRYKPPKKK